MFSKRYLPFLLSIILNVENVLSKTLVPIHPSSGGRNGKRQEDSCLDLLNSETFLWGDQDGSQIASLTVDMPGDEENIVSMEQFDGMIKTMTCNDDSLSITFHDDSTFAYAQRTWDWVNGADNHSFVMVVGPGNCGDNPNRIPFIVSTMQFDEPGNTATLAAQQSDWETIAHSYDLVVGSVPQEPSNSTELQTRDIVRTTSIDFTHDFPFSVPLSSGDLDASLACTNCSTTGNFQMEFRIKQKWFIPTGASLKLSPNGVSAIGQMKLSGNGDLTEALSKTFDIVSMPIEALDIPGILELGPYLKVALVAGMSPVSLSGSIQSGAKATLDNNAVVKLDLLHPSQNAFSGWMPQVEVLDISVDASVSTSLSLSLQPSVELQARALGQGFQVGLNMKVPTINAKFNAVVSTAGACPDADIKTNLGVNIESTIGAHVNVQALMSGMSDPLFNYDLANFERPLLNQCFSFGTAIAKREIGHPHVRKEITAFQRTRPFLASFSNKQRV